MESRDSVITYLQALADKELVELFADAVGGRSRSDMKGGEHHLLVADATLQDGRWDVSVIGREDPDRYRPDLASLVGEVFPNVPIRARGVCATCDAQVRSWAKQMLCPVCGSKVSGS